VRRQVPGLARNCPPVEPEHLCSAVQEVRLVRDRLGAAEFLRKHHAGPGETLCWPGIHGGFSALNVAVAEDSESVDLLAGVIADGRHGTGTALLRSVVQREGWIGRRLAGGSGCVPLRRPYYRLAAPGVALVGDAACQVFPAHGSGVGPGLLAARILADTVARNSDPGCEQATWAYQASFHRKYGHVLAAYDVFRRFSQTLSDRETALLIDSGLVTEAGWRAGLEHVLPAASLREPPVTLSGLARAAPMTARLGLALTRMAAASALYRLHPARPDESHLRRCSATVARLFGERPDVA
jgi:hypothetical protein